MSASRVLPVSGILLAAGRGRRFDPDGIEDKLLKLLPSGTSVLAQSAASLQAACEQICIVVRPDNLALQAHLDALGYAFVIAENADLGMAASLIAGLQASSESAGWIIALADMPWVEPDTIRKLKQSLHDGAQLALPFYRGQRGNPAAWAAACRPALMSLSGDRGARQVFDQFPMTEVSVDDAGILRDIDTPADLM